MVRLIVPFTALFVACVPAYAADDTAYSPLFSGERIYVGVGADNVFSKNYDPTAYGMIEYATSVQDETWGLRYRLGADVSGVGYWGGVGFSVEQTLDASPFYIEGSVMAGLYGDADKHDLGHAFEIRSQVMLGYILENGSDIAIGIAHKSNANIADSNPGTETIYVRYGTAF